MRNKRSCKDRKEKLSSMVEKIEIGRKESLDTGYFEKHDGCKIQNMS